MAQLMPNSMSVEQENELEMRYQLRPDASKSLRMMFAIQLGLTAQIVGKWWAMRRKIDADEPAQQRKDEEVVALLQDYFSRIWYPNGDDKAALMEATGLSLSQLNAWFSHERKKAKKELERLDELTYTLERDLRQTCWNIMAAYRILGLPILEMRDNMVDGSVLTFEESNWLVQMADGYGKMMQMPPQQLIAQMHQWFAEKDELAEELEVAQKEWKELATAHDHGLREGRDDY